MAFRVLTDFIQEDVIVDMLIDKLYATNVARNAVMVTSQASLGYGSSYKFPAVGDLTVNQYNGLGVTPEDATQANAIISIDNYPFINFYLEDSDVNESKALSLAGAWASEAAYRISKDIDVKVFATLHSGATTDAGLGITSAPIALTSDTLILDYVEAFATKLKESNIDTDAVLVVPSFVEVSLARSMGTLVQNQTVNGAIVAGKIGTLFGLDIFSSNNLPIGVAGGLVAGEYGVVGGKRSCFGLVEGTTIVKNGNSETKPATFNQYGMVYGADFIQALGWYAGVVSKS